RTRAVWFPPPLWGRVRGGTRGSDRAFVPPTPALPHKGEGEKASATRWQTTLWIQGRQPRQRGRTGDRRGPVRPDGIASHPQPGQGPETHRLSQGAGAGRPAPGVAEVQDA